MAKDLTQGFGNLSEDVRKDPKLKAIFESITAPVDFDQSIENINVLAETCK